MSEPTDDGLGVLIDEPVSGLKYRRYRRHDAAHDQPATARLLLLHGVGGNETNLEAMAAMIDTSIEVLLVRGPLTLGPEQYAWFQVRFSANGPVINAEQAEQSRLRLRALVQTLRVQDDAAPLRTIVGGFSQGGILSASVGLSAPEDVEGFAVLSGRILPELEPVIAPRDALKSLSAYIAHGKFDDKLPVSWAERSEDVLTELGVRHRMEIYPIGHELNSGVVAGFNRWLDGVLPAGTPAAPPGTPAESKLD